MTTRKPLQTKSAKRARRAPCPQAEALSEKLGETVARLRKAGQLSLGDLSEMSGVAKSMISQIEKNESNPTIATLSKISQALGTSVEAMFASGVEPAPETALVEKAAVQDIPVLTSDDGLCSLRIISSIGTVQLVQVYDFQAKSGGELVSSPHPEGTVESLTMLTGGLTVIIEDERWSIGPGETLRYRGDRPHRIVNEGDETAHATMVNIRMPVVRVN